MTDSDFHFNTSITYLRITNLLSTSFQFMTTINQKTLFFCFYSCIFSTLSRVSTSINISKQRTHHQLLISLTVTFSFLDFNQGILLDA